MFSLCTGQGHCFAVSVSVTMPELLYFWFSETSQEFGGSGKKKKQQNKKDEAHVSIPVPPEVWVSFDWNGNIWLFFFFLLFS